MIDEWNITRVARVHSSCDGNKSKIHLTFPTSMVEVLEAPFDL